jgi:hypothetical protein
MVKISEFGEDFLLLALRIDKHIKGYIDFYYGPEKLRQIVQNETILSPNILLNDSIGLLRQVRAQSFDKERERYLEKLLIAMKTSIELLNGAEFSIEEQFLRLYDVILKSVNEAELDKLKEEINVAYPGSGTLEERMKKLRVVRKVPEAKIIELFGKALKITKERTKDLFIDLLPESERISLELVNENNKEIKWSYYEWYLGNFLSRLDINPNYNIFWTSFLPVAAHEGYPGHHTEFVAKEMKLYNEFNQFEQSILLVHSPRLIISEGLANTAINMLFDYQEQAEISLQEFCSTRSKEDSIISLTAQNKVRGKITLFLYNFAYHALVDKWSKEQLFQYGGNFEIFSKENLLNQYNMVSDPVYSKNAFMYNIGENLILDKYGRFPGVKQFKNLLINPILPSDLD